MPITKPILAAQHQYQQPTEFTNTKDELTTVTINNRSIPYVALALGLYENQNNPIQFATEHLDQINSSTESETVTSISKVYSVLEVYADRLGSQKIIILPQLAELYGLAKKLSDEKIATAVLTSLIARHLAFKSDISHCQQTHIYDAKKIMASTKTYFRQEATVDATVYMVSSLCREPDNYQLAANQGSSAELKKLSGAKIFSVKNQNKVNSIRLLLIAAQNIALETEEKKLDDAYIIFTVKQELLKQGVEEKLANAISIVVGAAYFIEENNSIPQQTHLEQAAELLIKSEATINYQANQAFAIKLLQEYMRPQAKPADAILAAKQLKQDLLSGKSIEGQIKSKGRLAELSWEALTLVQDYAANYYFSLTDGAFKIERTNQGNGLYAAVLKSIQGVFIDEPDHPAHKLTPEQLAINIRKLLPNAKGIIVKQFNDIIYNNASILSVPATFADGLKTLQQNWQCREELSLEEKKSLQEDIANYLRDISTYYIAFVNNNPTIGSNIELQIIAHYYDLQIKLHSHVADNYKIINPDAKSMAHIFCALHQSRYHSLIIQKDLKLQQEPLSQLAYIEQAAMAAEQGRAARYLETAIGILSQNNPVVWQSNKAINQESLVQTIKDVFKQTKVVVLEDLKKRTKEKFKKTTTIDREPIQVPREYPLLLPLRQPEQLSIITKEAEVNIANIHLIVAQQAESLLRSKRTKVNYLKATLQDANAKAVIAFKLFGDAQKALYKVRHTAGLKEHGDALFEHSKTMHMASLKALGIATIEAYHEWWQNIIQEQLTAIETSFSATDKQITQYIEALTKVYEQQLTAVDNHYAAVLNKAIQDYNYHQRCVAEEERTAKRKRRQGMYRAFAGMAIAAFVAPHMASSLFAPGIGCTIATGAIAGGISSGIAGGNVLKGAAMAGLFAGFGFAVDGVLGAFITNNELLRESLNVAATASLSTAIYGGKVLDNVFISIGANAVAALIVPMPKFANKELTIQQANAINNRQVMRAFTRGITALAISKNSNLGTSLMIAGMSSLQTWVSHQANTFIQERRAIEQQANIVKTRNRLAMENTQPALQPALSTNTAGSRCNKLGYIGKGKSGGYKINLPEIQHPCAGGLQPRLPGKIPKTGKDYVTVNYQSIPPQSSFTRGFGSSVLDFFMPAAYADDLSASSSRPSSFTYSSNSSYLDVGFGEKLLILTGGGMKGVWSGIEQGYYMAGERLGILDSGTVAKYTDLRNQEMQLYNSTTVGQSKLRPWVEFGTDMVIYSAIPVAGYGRMGLLANSALSGGIIAGSQFVEDGKLSSRFANAGIGGGFGAGVGVAANKLRGPILKLFDLRNSSSIFNTTKQSSGLNWNFAPRLAEQLQDPRLGSLSGKMNSRKILELANNPKANFFLDKNTGHINVIQKVNGIPDKSLRITVIRDEQKIISVGVVRDTSLLHYTSNSSRYIEIGVKKISEQIKGP